MTGKESLIEYRSCKPPFIGWLAVRWFHVEWYRSRGFDFTVRIGQKFNFGARCHW